MSLTLSDVFAALYDFKVECPTGSVRMMNLLEVSKELSTSLTNIFLRDGQGRRAVYGGTEKFQNDPNWRDLILFYEYSMATTAPASERVTRPAGRASSPA